MIIIVTIGLLILSGLIWLIYEMNEEVYEAQINYRNHKNK
jgi:hypothetical protein